jgi:protein-tyrosine phosphatase
MIFVYTDGELRPRSFSDFVKAPAAFSDHPVIILEPFGGTPAPCTAPSTSRLSSADTSRAIHQNFKVQTYRFKEYLLWFLLGTLVSQTTAKEAIQYARDFPFSRYSSTEAIQGDALFSDLKPHISFATALQPPATPLRSSSPIRGAGKVIADPVITRTSIQTDTLRQPALLPVVRTNDYDLVVDHLYIGNESAARNSKVLNTLGITHVVNLNGNEANAGFPPGFEYCVVKLRDSPWETLTEEFWGALDFAKSAIEHGGSVLCHCRRGISRSAAFCIAYLMEVRYFGFDAAFALLKQRRPAVNPGQNFVDQLRERENLTKRPESGRRRMLVPALLVRDPARPS